MNQPGDELPCFDDPVLELEWQAQETAMRRERMGRGSGHEAGRDAGRDTEYRRLARILREPAPMGLPADFARRMAAQVAAASLRRVELVLLVGLLIALLAAVAAIGVTWEDRWLPPLGQLFASSRDPAGGWLVALGCCLAASWLLERWPRRR